MVREREKPASGIWRGVVCIVGSARAREVRREKQKEKRYKEQKRGRTVFQSKFMNKSFGD